MDPGNPGNPGSFAVHYKILVQFPGNFPKSIDTLLNKNPSLQIGFVRSRTGWVMELSLQRHCKYIQDNRDPTFY